MPGAGLADLRVCASGLRIPNLRIELICASNLRMVGLRIMNTQNESPSPKARSTEQARAAAQARWGKDRETTQTPTTDPLSDPSTPEAEPPPQADPTGTVRDRTGKVITNLGDANIIRNLWAYGPPYSPSKEELQAFQDARRARPESLCPA